MRWVQGVRRQLATAPPSPPDADRWVAERWDRMLRARYVGIVILGVAAGLIFSWWLGLLIGIFIAVYNGGHHLHLRRTGRPARWLPISDVLAGVALIAVEPRTMLPATLVMITAVAFATAAGARVPAAAATLAGTLALMAIAGLDHVPTTRIPALGFGLAGLLVLLGIGSLVESEARIRERLTGLVEDLDAVLWTRDPRTHRLTYVNGRAAGLLDLPVEDWTAPGFWIDHIHPDDREHVLETTRAAVDSAEDHDVAYRLVGRAGQIVHVLDRVTAITDSSGQVTELHGVTLDVSERRSIEQRSRQYADIVEHIGLGLVVVDVEGPEDDPRLRIVAANPAADQFFGRTVTGAIGLLATELFPEISGTSIPAAIAQVARTGEAVLVEDMVLTDASGSSTATVQAFRLPDDLVAVSLRDTTRVTRAARALRRQALHDALTGLPNRAQLDEHLRAQVASLGDGDRLALLIMDLDQFKEVNDALGHSVGDRLLISLADRLRTLLHGDFVARLGGDEFAIVLCGPEVDEAAATAVAERVAASLSAPFTIDEFRLQSNVSIGIALVPDHATDVDELVRRADVAMYVSKRGGHGHAVYRPDEDRSSVARLTLIGDLRDAVPQGQLVLHYQPVLDLHRGVVTRTEALVRWQHPDHGLLMPDTFIGLAALSGATRPIARWVLREATRAAAGWRAAGHEVGVAVNLSVRNLFDSDLLPLVEEVLADSGLPPGELIVELTESELMDDPSVALTQFHAFQALGVGTSVDDFGTGYSSLTYLRDLPLSEIKIDRSFVGAMHRRGGAYTIVRSMIDLGHNLGLEVVAEGAEHADDLPTLARLGCDRVQGFHIARPMPEADLLRWLDEDRARGESARPSRSA